MCNRGPAGREGQPAAVHPCSGAQQRASRWGTGDGYTGRARNGPRQCNSCPHAQCSRSYFSRKPASSPPPGFFLWSAVSAFPCGGLMRLLMRFQAPGFVEIVKPKQGRATLIEEAPERADGPTGTHRKRSPLSPSSCPICSRWRFTRSQHSCFTQSSLLCIHRRPSA